MLSRITFEYIVIVMNEFDGEDIRYMLWYYHKACLKQTKTLTLSDPRDMLKPLESKKQPYAYAMLLLYVS
jgi:hypothetical protein